MEERLQDLEVRLARQEDTIDELNRLSFRQQQRIGELEAMCAGLARRIKALQESSGSPGAVDEKPPHY